MTRLCLTFAWLALLAACSPPPPKPLAPEPVKAIDAGRFFTGRWYQIGRTPTQQTTNCVAGTTDYYRNADGTLMERDACRMPAGQEKVWQGPVSILSPANNKIAVHHIVYGFIPASRTYWLLDHGDDYGWFIVSDPAFDMLALFTREPRPSAAEVAALAARATALGYPAARLEYPPRFPVGARPGAG